MTNEKKKKSVARIICEEALRENTELKRYDRLNGRWAKKSDAIEENQQKNIDFRPFFFKHTVSLIDEPVSLETFMNFDPNVTVTAGYYSITYYHPQSKKYVRGKPFAIGQDMIRGRILVSGYAHLKMLAKKIPELAWMLRWCPLLDHRLFAVAKCHVGKTFFFTPDWASYGQLIKDKAKQQGIDIHDEPFVSYECKQETKDEINKTHLLAPMKSTEDYRDVIKEVENNPTEEMQKDFEEENKPYISRM